MKAIQRKIKSLETSYKRELTKAVQISRQAQKEILNYYTDDLIKSFKTWEDLLEDINFVCGDLGTGKLIAISLLKEKYKFL